MMGRVWRAFTVLILFAIGTSLITPLIPIYKDDLGFNDTVVTLFLVAYVAALVPSMLTMGQLSDRIGRRGVLLTALTVIAVAQILLATQPPLWVILVARGLQGFATGAFFGTCSAWLVELAPPNRRGAMSVLSSISVRAGLGLGPGLGGVFAQYLPDPLRTPFLVHLAALIVAIVIVIGLPETVIRGPHRPLTISLEVPAAERSVFWRVLVPSGMLLSLFDAVCLSLVPVFQVRELGVTNYALVGASGFLVLTSGAVSQVILRDLSPIRSITGGLIVACVAFIGVICGAPLQSAPLLLASVAVTGGACGLVMKGGIDLATRIAPPQDLGKLISSYYVACYLGGFSVPLVIVGVLADLIGLTTALVIMTIIAAVSALWTILVGLRSVHGLTPAGADTRLR